MSNYSDYTSSGVTRTKTALVATSAEQTVFSLSYNVGNEDNVDVYLNGVLNVTGYTLTLGTTLTLDTGAQINDKINTIELILN